MDTFKDENSIFFSYVLTLCGDFIYPFTNAIFHILDIFNNYVGLPNQDDHSACLNGMGQLDLKVDSNTPSIFQISKVIPRLF